MTGFESKRQMAQGKVQEEMKALYTKRNAAQAKVNDDDDTQIYADTLTVVYQRGFADGKRAAQKQEPTCPECNAAVLYECVACSSNNYPPAAKWDKPSASFNEWWDSNVMPPANPFAEGSAAYWAWAGWKAAQCPWQGLTEQDMPSGEDPMFDHQYFIAGMVYVANVLREKNT